MSIEWERRLHQLEARVDELLRSLTREPAADGAVAGEPKPEAAPARRRDANGRFVR
jgi:hypothetical protein